VRTVTDARVGPSSPTRRARWFLLGLHLALVAVAPVFTITGFEGDPGTPLVAVPAALAIGGLQLRHSLAAARGGRPRHWPWSLAALVALVYLPMLWFSLDWAPMQYFVIASGAMLLAGWPAATAAVAPLVGTAAAVSQAPVYGDGGAQGAFFAVYWVVGLATGAVALYGSARLVRVVAELDAARTELAELAVGRERLRVSRDLHDLLGHSLSAVSLKGDLAIRLLGRDPPAARAEIESLTGVAREALRGVRAVARDEHAISLRTETDGAVALLGAAGIRAHVDLDLPELSQATETVLAWAVREGVTNVLRHSRAGTCSITAAVRDGTLWLAIVNDGMRDAAGTGSGLAGLTGRARDLSGSVTAGPVGAGRFRLLVELPLEAS
jgi:two-component system, NarL family, sensor histidine kinase DesK